MKCSETKRKIGKKIETKQRIVHLFRTFLLRTLVVDIWSSILWWSIHFITRPHLAKQLNSVDQRIGGTKVKACKSSTPSYENVTNLGQTQTSATIFSFFHVSVSALCPLATNGLTGFHEKDSWKHIQSLSRVSATKKTKFFCRIQ